MCLRWRCGAARCGLRASAPGGYLSGLRLFETGHAAPCVQWFATDNRTALGSADCDVGYAVVLDLVFDDVGGHTELFGQVCDMVLVDIRTRNPSPQTR